MAKAAAASRGGARFERLAAVPAALAVAGLALGLAAAPAADAQQIDRQTITGAAGGVTANIITGSTFNLRGLSEEDRREIEAQVERLVRDLRGELAATARVLGGQLEASGAARAQAERRAAEIGAELNLTRGAAVQLLAALGQQEVPPERVAERLREAVVQYRETLARLDALQGSSSPAVRALREEARGAFLAGRFDEADRVSLQAAEAGMEAVRQARTLREQAERVEQELLLNVAADIGTRGNVAMTRLRYAEAAGHYAAAAGAVPAARPGERRRYLVREATALYLQGTERGDNAAAAAAIERFRALAAAVDRAADPFGWAATQMSLGTALVALGERERHTARLEEAVQAYRATLQEWTRERVPLGWAMAQMNLGNALQALGEREAGPAGAARLEEAVQAYRAALQERTRERDPFGWAMTQMNLGAALATLGSREAGPAGAARLEEAVQAFRAALQEFNREGAPLGWAMAQMNLGNALQALGEREAEPAGAARLEAAAVAYRATLQELTREHATLEWAMAQMSLGTALFRLGSREAGPAGAARLEEAVAAFDACLVATIAVWPIEWVNAVRALRDETRAEIERRKAE